MANYDFKVLNDKDFESLVCDLLSVNFSVRLERFKSGKDAGVDLRWFCAPRAEAIVQCKHWPRSTLATIIRHIKKSELEKVQRLAPARYIFVCSLELSRANKTAIVEAFAPYILSDTDVLGAEDLQDLLGRHPDVERKHYKLWLGSSTVLAALINNGVIGRSEDAIGAIREDLVRYVETSETVRARERLVHVRILIIKGEPGIGKTTLAKQLVAESAGDGFKLVVVEQDVGEAESVFDSQAKQIFYFDDFLGRNFLEAISDNKDSHIVNFIGRVVRDKNKRFVLTTRTHILDRGKELSEIFRIGKVSNNEFELAIGALSRLEKAKILYSHIWSSGMPPWAIEEIYKDKRYLQIVDHRNYNPRLIAFITDADRLREIEPSGFWSYVVGTLDNPEAIWAHVFDRQLGDDSRDIASLVAFAGKPVLQDALEDAFLRLNSRSDDNPLKLRQRFATALKLAVGSVVNRVIDGGGPAKCTLFNPSIADYLLNMPEVSQLALVAIRSLRTLDSLNYLESLREAKMVSEQSFTQGLLDLCQDCMEEGRFEGEFVVHLAGAVLQSGLRGSAWEFCVVVANRLVPESLQDAGAEALGLISRVALSERLDGPSEMYDGIVAQLESIPTDAQHVLPIRHLAEYLDTRDSGDRLSLLRDRVVGLVLELARDTVSEERLLDDLIDPADIQRAQDSIDHYFRSLFREMGLEVKDSEIDDIVGEINYEDVINDNISSMADDYNDDPELSIAESSSVEIIDYFDRGDAEPGG